MNIIYISKYGSFGEYGMETRHIYLSREMVQQGHNVEVFFSNANHYLTKCPSKNTESLDGVRINWINTLRYRNAYSIRRFLSWFHFEYNLRKKLNEDLTYKPDVVIISSLSLLSILTGIKLKKKFGSTLVFEVRDIWPLVLGRIANVSRWNPIYQYLSYVEKKGYTKSDLVVGTMPNLKEHIQGRVNLAKKVLWIPHLNNTKIVPKMSHRHAKAIADIRRKYSKIVCYAGSINKSSSLEVFMQVSSLDFDKNVAFVLLGDGPLLESYKKNYRNSNLFFFNKIPQNEVVAFLKDCDVLYDGYLKSETYNYGNSRNKYVEYCQAEKPIILSYEGYPLFVENYNIGLVVKPESEVDLYKGIKSLLSENSEYIEVVSQNARTFVREKLDIKKQVDKLLDSIECIDD